VTHPEIMLQMGNRDRHDHRLTSKIMTFCFS
jgi:hypothetical protein